MLLKWLEIVNNYGWSTYDNWRFIWFTSLILDKAFDKKKALKERLLYIILYILVLVLIITSLIIGGVSLIKDNNLIGIPLLIFAVLFIVILIYPFIKKNY